MSPLFGDAHGQHKCSDVLALQIARACERAGMVARAFSEQDYAGLPAFNWDVTDYEECAAVHLMDQAVSILHVVSVLADGEMIYRAKTLFRSPASILASPDYDGGAFSVSFGRDRGDSWSGDNKTALEELIAGVLNKHAALSEQVLSAHHCNVNVWLEHSRYMSVNTGKQYTTPTAAVDFVHISNTFAEIILGDPALVWKVPPV